MAEVLPAVASRAVVVAGALLFLLTGLSKAMNIDQFAAILIAQDRIPTAWAHPAAIAVTATECGSGTLALLLLVRGGPFERIAGWVLAILAAVLTGYLFTLWLHPPAKAAHCGCGLGGSRLVTDWSGLLMRSGGLTGAFVLAGFLMPGGRTPPTHETHVAESSPVAA